MLWHQPAPLCPSYSALPFGILEVLERGTVKLGDSRLQALLESAKLLSSSLALNDLLAHLLRTVMGRLLVSKAVIAVDLDGSMRVALARGVPSLSPGDLFTEEVGWNSKLEQFFPIEQTGKAIGMMAIGRPARGFLEPEEEDFTKALLGLAASSVANAQAHEATLRSNEKLEQKVQELRALIDLGRGVSASLEPDDIAQMLTLTLAGRWIISKHGIVTWKEGHPEILRQKGLDLAFVLADTERWTQLAEPTLAPADTSLPAGSLVLPLRSSSETFGVVVCGPRLNKQPYTEGDIEFGGGLAAQAAISFDNAWHFRDTLVRQQMEKEVALAASIQRDLFPAVLPQLALSDVAAANRQAKLVGGDYYDVLPIQGRGPELPHLLCVVDISGKGMFAALLMSNIQATLRALLSQGQSLSDVAQKANNLLHATTPANRYATAFLTQYDPVTGSCQWVNCGHNDGVVLRKSGEVEKMPCSNIALGLFPKITYETQTFELQSGDLLAIYSDGVTEANDAAEQEFSMERFVAVLKAQQNRPASEIVSAVLKELDAFVGDAPQFDDITLMVMKRL
jgi:sigma-B regulation protein RsbU (phosphoserine phosphatase)